MKFKTPLKEQTMVKKHRARQLTATAREHGLNRTRERTQEIRGKKIQFPATTLYQERRTGGVAETLSSSCLLQGGCPAHLLFGEMVCSQDRSLGFRGGQPGQRAVPQLALNYESNSPEKSLGNLPLLAPCRRQGVADGADVSYSCTSTSRYLLAMPMYANLTVLVAEDHNKMLPGVLP